MWHDMYRTSFPEMREAVRRLNICEPHLFDARQIRLYRGHNLLHTNEVLPKEQWHTWEKVCCLLFSIHKHNDLQETFYLQKYLDEIEDERIMRTASTGIKNVWWYDWKAHMIDDHHADTKHGTQF
jgi:hypothetical protein